MGISFSICITISYYRGKPYGAGAGAGAGVPSSLVPL